MDNNPHQSFVEKEIILVDFHRNTAELESLPLPADGRPETSLVVARISVKPVLEYIGAREAVKVRNFLRDPSDPRQLEWKHQRHVEN